MLFFHIGRSKSGSTTIQHFLHGQKQRLEEAGFVISEFLDSGAGSHARLKNAISRGHAADLPALEDFKRVISNKQTNTILSSEFFIETAVVRIPRYRELVGDTPVKIIVYLRDYPAWLVSLYVQATRKGSNALPFDDYYNLMLPKVSPFKKISVWADVFGWENMRIRSLDRGALVGKDLLADFRDAIGIPPEMEFGEVHSVNVGGHWLLSEFRRALGAQIDEERAAKRESRSFRDVMTLFASCINRFEGDLPLPQYLTLAQSRKLESLFNRDVVAITAKTGVTIPLLKPKVTEERTSVPSLKNAPRQLLNLFAKRLGRPQIWDRQEPHVQKSVQELLDELGVPRAQSIGRGAVAE
jgi:hypothetical protein